MIINDLEIYGRRSNKTIEFIHMYTQKPLGIKCKFNEWGFRGPDYNEYVGLPVNICLGDSFTVNTGGPVEDCWASQLEEILGYPTLNFGLDGAGNDAMKLIYDRVINYFDIRNVFVMYSFLHRRLIHGLLSQSAESDLDMNIRYFEQQFIPNAHYTFIPEWCWSDEEANYIRAEYPQQLPDSYTQWQATGYAKKKHRIQALDKDLFNSDGMHMSRERNQSVAEYFAKLIL